MPTSPPSMTLAAFCEEGERAWAASGIAVQAEAFARHLHATLGDASLAGLVAADMYLAYACLAGDRAALAAFERRYGDRLERDLRAAKLPRDIVDETRAQLHERLFVGERPRIASYAGRGPLENWLRIAALRIASNLQRSARDRARLEGLGGRNPAAPPLDPELALVKARHRHAFERALADAFASLEPNERNVLRLHFLDGTSIDGMAAIFHVHRATAARRLQAARQRLQERTLSLLAERWRLAPSELDSALKLVRSRLEASVRTLLARSSG